LFSDVEFDMYFVTRNGRDNSLTTWDKVYRIASLVYSLRSKGNYMMEIGFDAAELVSSFCI